MLGIAEGAQVSCRWSGRPEGISKGYFVKPTVFADVNNDMTIAREEIFGPVLCMIPYTDENDAVRIANDTPYGLSGFVSSGDIEHARRVAKRIRSGNVHINNAQGRLRRLLRRLQTIGQRPGMGRGRAGGIPRTESHLWLCTPCEVRLPDRVSY